MGSLVALSHGRVVGSRQLQLPPGPAPDLFSRSPDPYRYFGLIRPGLGRDDLCPTKLDAAGGDAADKD